MSEPAPIANQSPTAAQQWSPSGVIITSIIAATALFFVLTIVVSMALMAAMVVIDVPH